MASYSGALPLNDIYSYISTVYPHFNRRDQPWMSSVRHSLSVNEAFERVPDQDGSTTRKGRGKGMTRLKGGLWRIKPGHQDCFQGGNFVRKGAKGAGPGKNLGGRKRMREDDEERSHKKSKANKPSPSLGDSCSRPNSALASTSSQPLLPTAPGSSRHCSPATAPSDGPSVPTAATTLETSQSTIASGSSLRSYGLPPSSSDFAQKHFSGPGLASPGSPDVPLAHSLIRPSSAPKTNVSALGSSLEPGFQLEIKDRHQVCLAYFDCPSPLLLPLHTAELVRYFQDQSSGG